MREAGNYSARYMASLGQVFPPGVTATGKPGELFIEGVGVRKFADMRQDIIYDRVLFTPAAIPAGTDFVYYRDIQGKTRQDTNMSQSSRLPEGQEAIVYRMNVMPQADMDEADVRLICAQGYAEAILDDDLRIKSGPVVTFPSAWGTYGNEQTTTNLATVGVMTNGVPSPGANPRLMIPVYLAENRTFRFDIKFFTLTTLSATGYVYVIYDVLWVRPLR